jgi:hypothetical protein
MKDLPGPVLALSLLSHDAPFFTSNVKAQSDPTSLDRKSPATRLSALRCTGTLQCTIPRMNFEPFPDPA